MIELHYLPSIQYVSKGLLHDAILLDGAEHYQKGSYRNRCRIAGPQGVQRLSIPLTKGKNERMPIREVRVSTHTDWQRQHWRSLQAAYGKSPFFEHYADELARYFETPTVFLWDWNEGLLRRLAGWLGLEVSIKETVQWHVQPAPTLHDLRNSIHPKAHRRLPDPRFSPVAYGQVFQDRHGFLPNLSALDLLCCCGPEARLILIRSTQTNA